MSDAALYPYVPSLPAAAALAGVFFLSNAIHAIQLLLSKSWHILPLFIGGLFQVVGYISRAIGHSEAPSYSLGPYIVQSLLILIAPVLMAATLYMIMGHMIVGLKAERYSPIRRRLFTKVFVLGDVVSFLVQGSGAGLVAKPDPESQDAGRYIIIGGLILQLLIFGYFMFVMLFFIMRMNKNPTIKSTSLDFSWKNHWTVVFVASALIMVRSIFRVVEYLQGTEGYLLTHEVFLYIFDAAPMAAVFVILNGVHPSQITALATGRRCLGSVLSVHRPAGDVGKEAFGHSLSPLEQVT